jgi:5'-3' exonuclease
MAIVLIIDGDVICHGACDNRWGSVYDEPKVFTKEDDAKYAAECIDHLNQIIMQLRECTFADVVKIAIKGDNNFRHGVYDNYKHTRTQTRPVQTYVDMLREYLDAAGIAERAHGMEADDLLRIWHTEAIANGDIPIIASIDKDLLCMPGKHYRFPRGTLYESGSRSPELIIEVNEWDAAVHWHKQILMGDATDGIPGLPKVGPKRADAILADCKTIEDLQYMTCYAYKEIIGAKWKEFLVMNGKLITILPTRGYVFSIDDWKQPTE